MGDAVIITRGSSGNLARQRRAVYMYEGVGWIYDDRATDKRAVANFTTHAGKGARG